MPIRAEFRWRDEPARLFLSFSAVDAPQVRSTAILFPVVAESRISSTLAIALRDFGQGTIVGRTLVTSFDIQGTSRHDFLFLISRLLPGRATDGFKAGILLGLDFIAACGRASLEFDGAVASMEIQSQA